MHQCLKCGRTISNLGEIESGCPCGSKVFVFSRHGSAGPAKMENASSLPTLGKQAPTDSPSAVSSPSSPAWSNPPARKSRLTLMSFGAPKAEADGPKAPQAPASSPPLDGPVVSAPHPSDSVSSKASSSPNLSAASAQKAPVLSAPASAETALTPSTSATAAPDRPSTPLSPMPASPGVASAPISDEEEEEFAEPHTEVWLAKGGQVTALSSGIENVRQLRRGVYEVDVKALAEGPIVMRDAQGVYYVRLPFAQLPGPSSDNDFAGSNK